MMRVVFMGTPEFSVPTLRALVRSGYAPVGVVTGPDRPRGRGQAVSETPVKKASRELGIQTVLQPESVKSADFARQIRALSPDLIVVVAFKILPPDVFTAPTFGSINLHGSLLPKYRGAAPINRAVMAGESETGVTTFFLKEIVDTGHIILQEPLTIGPDETAGEVHDRMMLLGADVVVRTVRLIQEGSVRETPQDDRLATPAPKIFREDCRIPWHEPAGTVHNHVRGLSPYPGAWTLYQGHQIKVFRTKVRPDAGGVPGTVAEADSEWVVTCGRGALEILEAQLEGRRRMDAASLLRGFPLETGSRLE